VWGSDSGQRSGAGAIHNWHTATAEGAESVPLFLKISAGWPLPGAGIRNSHRGAGEGLHVTTYRATF